MKTRSRARNSASFFLRAMLALFVTAVIAMFAYSPVARLDAPDVYAIRGARVITGSGKTLAKGTVVFRDGLITDVGENVKVPADARVIDGTGLTVYPGLIDAYTSLGLPAPPQAQPTGGGRQAAIAAAASGQQPQPELVHGDPSISAADQVRPGGTAIEDERAVGVTAALSSPRQGIFPGQGALINLSGGEVSRLILRATVALTVQFTSSSEGRGVYPNSLMGTVAFIRQSFYDAMNYRNQTERYNRVKRGVTRPEYDKKLAALQPALRGEMPVVFVAQSDGDIRRALMIADEFKLKPIIAGGLFSYRVADLLRARNVPVILSVDFPKRSADFPEDEDEPIRVLRDRAEAPQAAAKLARAGVKFAFTSGNLRPDDFIANLRRTVESGLSREDALRALTISAAEILGSSDQLGSIEVGKIANIVVTSGDLLARDTKVRYLFIDGDEIELKKPEAAQGGRGRPSQAAQPSAGAVDPTGEWTLVVRTSQGDQQARLSLRREGDQITGAFTGPRGTSDLKNVALTGNRLRFTTSVQLPDNADTQEAIVDATIEGDTMRGTVSLTAIGTFDFTGTRPR